MSEPKLYRYDTHVHTSEGSKCARSSGREVAEAYHARGYDGIIVTDHFFNGNSAVPRDLPWRERVELFTAGYRAAKEYGDRVGLQVFFAWEDSSEGNDFLTYGLDENWLADHPFLDRLPLVDYLKYIRAEGGRERLGHEVEHAPGARDERVGLEIGDRFDLLFTALQPFGIGLFSGGSRLFVLFGSSGASRKRQYQRHRDTYRNN